MSDEIQVTPAELVRRMQQGWDEFQAYLKTLTVEQMTLPTDAAGWTVKDHLMHLAVWEDGIYALLRRQSRPERMGLDAKTWESGDYDRMNAVIQQRHHDKSLEDVLNSFQESHRRLVDHLQTLADADLMRPYRDYAPNSTTDRPVYAYIVGNTYGHYEEHLPWIDAIANRH